MSYPHFPPDCHEHHSLVRDFGLNNELPRPKIICLCGSTRFIETFAIKTWELELEGHIVLGCTLLPASYCPVRDHFAEHLGVKEQRDEHYLRKIDLADEILALNVGNYVGSSTHSEIEYAYVKRKPIRWLEVPGCYVLPDGCCVGEGKDCPHEVTEEMQRDFLLKSPPLSCVHTSSDALYKADGHDLYKTGDPDASDSIKDRNGEVVLSCCRTCGLAEVELEAGAPCLKRKVERVRILSHLEMPIGWKGALVISNEPTHDQIKVRLVGSATLHFPHNEVWVRQECVVFDA